MRIIAFVTDHLAIHSILTSLGEPAAAPQVASASGPPLWEQAPQLHSMTTATSAPIEELGLLEESRRRSGNPVD